MRLLTLFISLILVTTGCCSARVNLLPKAGNRVLAMSNSASESCAYEKASEKAREYCRQRGKKFIVLNEQSQYQGMDKTTKGVIQGVTSAIGSPAYMDSSEDYRVNLLFRCR